MKNFHFKWALLTDSGKHPRGKSRIVMNWKTFVFLLLINPLNIIAQEYLPLPVEDAVWSITYQKITLAGDTVINDVLYSKIMGHDMYHELTPSKLIYFGALRQDLCQGKVWAIWKDEQEESLLYDFSVELDQEVTVRSLHFENNYQKIITVLKAISISSVLIDSVFRKTITFSLKEYHYDGEKQSVKNLWWDEVWIEGIGSNYGLLYSGPGMEPYWPWYSCPRLLCFKVNDHLVYSSDEVCFSTGLNGIDEVDGKADDGLKVVPSFVDDVFSIRSTHDFSEIAIYNISGQIVFTHHFDYPVLDFQMSINDWKNGFYIIKVSEKNRIQTIKFFKK